MILVWNAKIMELCYHLTRDDSFNYTSLQRHKVACGKSVDVRTSYRDISEVISDGLMCPECRKIYEDSFGEDNK